MLFALMLVLWTVLVPAGQLCQVEVILDGRLSPAWCIDQFLAGGTRLPL
jgi:hypothetical protein